jgi:hypothetical protein
MEPKMRKCEKTDFDPYPNPNPASTDRVSDVSTKELNLNKKMKIAM